MSIEIADAIRDLAAEREISEVLIRKLIEDFLLAAYHNTFESSDNAVVQFEEDGSTPTLYSQKEIVEEVHDKVKEISLDESLDYSEEAEIGDQILIEVDPHEFTRNAINSAKQVAIQSLREIQKDVLFAEYGDRVGELVWGEYIREHDGDIYVSLTSSDGLRKTDGTLPQRFQSPGEEYRLHDRIKAIIYEVKKGATGLQIVLSRTHTDFVRELFKREVAEIADGSVEIYKIVREPGHRTKIAIYSNHEDVDPVGACVGVRGARIQAIVKELEGEKVDIVKYDNDPAVFISYALSPADISQVYILNKGKKTALAIVRDDQLSLAIGKMGLNVRLANRLVDWSIDVKTRKQAAKSGIEIESTQKLSELFSEKNENEEPENTSPITHVSELREITAAMVLKLQDNRIEKIEELSKLTSEERAALRGFTPEEISSLESILGALPAETVPND